MTSPLCLSGLRTSLLLAFICMVAPGAAHSVAESETETIHIAAYEFPPYFSSSLDEHLVGSILHALNERQQSYYFTVTEVRPTQRHRALLVGGCCDMIMFEDPQWGWQDSLGVDFIAGVTLTYGADLYLAAEDPLEVLQGDATVGGVQGYHYQLTGYQHDTDVLERDHSLYLADNHMTLLNMLRRERLDVVIISEEMIRFLHTQDSPLLADFDYQTAVDQEYYTQIIARSDRAKLLDWLDTELNAMWQEGELAPVFQRFGLEHNLHFTPEQKNAVEAEF